MGSGLSPVTGDGHVTLDLGATLLTAYSEKEQGAPSYKHGYSFHPLGCWVDSTSEALAAILRPGSAGSSTAADHVAVMMGRAPVCLRTSLPPDASVSDWARGRPSP